MKQGKSVTSENIEKIKSKNYVVFKEDSEGEIILLFVKLNIIFVLLRVYF